MGRAWAAGLLMISLAAHATVYRWVGPNGVVNYSNSPHPGAVQVNLNAAPYSLVTAPAPVTSQQNNSADLSNAGLPSDTPQPAASASESLSIVSPVDQQTFQNQPLIPVQFTFPGSLPDGGTFNLYLDGKVASAISKGNSFSLNSVARGMHTLQVKALDQNGTVLAESQSITLYVHQNAIQVLKSVGQ